MLRLHDIQALVYGRSLLWIPGQASTTGWAPHCLLLHLLYLLPSCWTPCSLPPDMSTSAVFISNRYRRGSWIDCEAALSPGQLGAHTIGMSNMRDLILIERISHGLVFPRLPTKISTKPSAASLSTPRDSRRARTSIPNTSPDAFGESSRAAISSAFITPVVTALIPELIELLASDSIFAQQTFAHPTSDTTAPERPAYGSDLVAQSSILAVGSPKATTDVDSPDAETLNIKLIPTKPPVISRDLSLFEIIAELRITVPVPRVAVTHRVQ
jgi:hypothetical protein